MFNSARLKLTAWYLLMIGFISIAFSGVIYRMMVAEIDRFARVQILRMEQQFPDMIFIPGVGIQTQPKTEPAIDIELIEETKNRLAWFLIAVNGVILLTAGGMGYILAGKTLQPIKSMVDEQNRFISDASHELRTPLTALKSSLEVNLRDKNLKLSDARKLMAESVEEVNRLQALSDSLLSLAQFQKPNGQTEFEKVDLANIIERAIKKMTPQAELKNIKISSTGSRLIIDGNQYTLADLITIILDNAVKYSSEKGTVQVSTSKYKGQAVIKIEDQGVGIDEKDLPHIFDRFFRGNLARTKTETGGYGLGLAIARQIVDKHHGIITVTSKPKKGSTFTIRLPLKQRFS